MNDRIEDVCLTLDATIRDAMGCIDRSAAKIALIVDDHGSLVDTITDGDVRRALLGGIPSDDPVAEIKRMKGGSPSETPVTAGVGTRRSALLRLMRNHNINQVPLVDDELRVVALTTRKELTAVEDLPVRAVIMGGGFGSRLGQLTENIPKPMLPVGDRPLLELIVQQLRDAGINQLGVTTHYKGEVIRDYFGNGADFGVELSYIQEDEPLGTAGSLGLLDVGEELVLVVNGDVLTRIDYRSVVDFHREHGADITIALRQHELTVPYGVVDTEGVTVTSIAEKPVIRNFISAGVYLLDPSVCRLVPRGEPMDMPDVISKVIEQSGCVVGFPVREAWLDIGHLADYMAAQHAVWKDEP
jgi:dTDP-glucose pyrophosphorylase